MRRTQTFYERHADDINALSIITFVILILTMIGWIALDTGYQDGYCSALHGSVIGTDACDVNGKVVYLP